VRPRRSNVRRLVALAYAAPLVGLASQAWADSDQHFSSAQGDVAFVQREIGSVQSAVDRARAEKRTPEQRLANGELLYRTKDVNRAIVVFSELIQELCPDPCAAPPPNPTFADAMWLRGETYYAAHEYLAARRDYRYLVEHSSDARFQTYFGKALARLVDIALRLNDPPESLKDLFDKFNQVPPAQVDAGLLYAKGKASYAKGQAFFTKQQFNDATQSWNEATQSFQSVAANTPYTHQARYFQGLIAMKLARVGGASGAPADPNAPKGQTANYKQAIEVFRQITVLPPDTPEHQHVIDLGWMAIGRLFYEMEQYQQASEAYAKVGRDSPEFDTMLYELAWVYVRLGDVQRAERALEVLAITDPGSPYIADGTLLRADLLLRAGAFEKALQLYLGVRAEYEPKRDKVTEFLKNTDVNVFYQKLSAQNLDILDQGDQLPSIAIRWAREAEDGPMAFAVIDDLNECKRLLRESQLLVDKLTALTGAANRVRAFPELQAGEETALMLINRIGHAQLEIARGLDDEEPGDLGGEIGDVRAKRRALMGAMAALPTTQADFAAREQQGQRQWNNLSQELTRRGQEVDQLQAVVNGLRRMLKDDAQKGIARDPASVQRFNAELDANEKDLKRYREQIAELRRYIEIGRAQVGLGDARYQADAEARMQFRDYLDREVQLAVGGAAGGSAQRYAQRVQGTLGQARQIQDQLISAFNALEAKVEQKIGELRAKIDFERNQIAKFQGQLDSLDTEARDLVGQVARRNFGIVRDKLKGIVLRADIGITEQAWEVREEELDRVNNLIGERARQEQLLDEELKEVRDDGVDPDAPQKQQ
jgi:tetratricopeptide (TPR) repeat protein